MMFYENLTRINKKFGLPPAQLKQLDETLTILRPEETVSPNFISRKTKVPLDIVEKILMELAFTASLGVKFIIFCDNEDNDLVHGFEFISRKELRQFVKTHYGVCPECESELRKDDIRIAYVRKDFHLM